MKELLLAISLLYTFIFYGQDGLNTNASVFSKKASVVSFSDKYELGFNIGFGASNYRIKATDINQSLYKDSVNSISHENRLSTIVVGSYYERRPTNQIAFRIGYTIHGDALSLVYNTPTGREELNIFNASLTFPFDIIIQSKGDRYRLYIPLGFSPLIGLGPEKGTREKYAIKQFDFLVEGGLGMYIRLEKLFVCPELKLMHGLLNINAQNQTKYAQTINSLKRQNIVLSITLSGH